MRGTTLIELMITLSIIAIIFALVSIVPRHARPARATPSGALAQQARHDAIVGRRRVTLVGNEGTHVVAISAWPDGVVIADSSLRLNPFTGAPDATAPK